MVCTANLSYDIWDLGEFEQKGSKGTKWGTKEDLLKAINVASDNGIITYIDAVLNHKYVNIPTIGDFSVGTLCVAELRAGPEQTTRRSSWPPWSTRTTVTRRSARCTTFRVGQSEPELRLPVSC